MAKHRLEQPKVGHKTVRGAVVAGSITLGAVGVGVGPALATPVNVPGIGTVDVPGITKNQVPPQFKPQAKAKKGPHAAPKLPSFGSSEGQKAASVAVSKIGAPYQYGAAGPNAFDCSGLVYYAHQQAGKSIPRDSWGQLGGGTAVAEKDLQPGDVVIMNGGSHAAIYVGNGTIVEAQTEGSPVTKNNLANVSFYSGRRF